MAKSEKNPTSPFLPVRQPGPPKVWAVIDGVKKDGQPAAIKFTIQEIPEDRYEDAVDHMVTYFLADEPVCQSVNGKDDPEFVENFRSVWRDLLKQGISVAAFVDDPNGGKPIIAGVNMLGVDFKGQSSEPEDFQMTSKKALNVLRVIMDLSKKAFVYERYGVDKYLFAFGLSVQPSYRGQSLGGHILRVRENIGREYGIPVTSTAFTSPISQKLAERCGFEVVLERDYTDITDHEGKLAFPDIKVKTFKIMARRL